MTGGSVQVTVCYHALLHEHTGRRDELYEIPNLQSTAGDVLNLFVRKYPAIEKLLPMIQIAVNDEMAGREMSVRDGDRIDLLPPFGGG